MKILLLNTQMEAGGAQKALLTLAQGLKDHGHFVTVVTMYDKGDFVSNYRRQYGVNIVDLAMKRPGAHNPLIRIVYGLKGLLRLAWLIRREKYDVVQTFSHYSNLIGPIIALMMGIPVRLSSQRASLRTAPGWLRLADRLITNSPVVQKMTVVSEGTREFCIHEQAINPDKLITIYNSVDVNAYHTQLEVEQKRQLRKELGISGTAPIVITVARLHPQKGHKYLLEAIPRISSKVPDVQFLFVGDGELCAELRMTVKKAELSEVVHFLGVRLDVPLLLSVSDCFVLPSLWEGLPNAVLEAMAVGLPVVATSVDGCPEIIRHEETGLLVPPANPDALAQAIERVLTDQGHAEAMGRAGKQRVIDCFSVEKNLHDYVTLYNDLMLKQKSKANSAFVKNTR